jgi:electron transfer flavoprotein alpha subunit
MTEGDYRHVYVVIEHINGKLLPVSLEMLGEARRLFDDFNTRYSSKEKVVAILLGHNIQHLSKTLIEYGADSVIIVDRPELNALINKIHTKVICQICLDIETAAKIEPAYSLEFKRPRYMFFAADGIGRHLSSTVLAELDSGLASDVNQLVISDLDISHPVKTGGKHIIYKKTLEMYRVDFSGFLWTTILCLDNANENLSVRDYSPQSCNIIPGAFVPIEQDPQRTGKVIEFSPKIDEEDLKIKVLSEKFVESEIDFDNYKTIVGFGRGIQDAPEKNIKLVETFAKHLNAQIGVSLPIAKNVFTASPAISSTYMIPARVIGTSGSKISPMLYIVFGVSGAMQHVSGMEDSQFVISVNSDENAPIKDVSDIFLKGRMEDVIPLLIEELQKQEISVQVK